MQTAAEILDSLEATPTEREIIHEAQECIRREFAWDDKKRNDPTMPRQARFQGTTASTVLARLRVDAGRFAALAVAWREGLWEEGIEMAGKRKRSG